MNEFLWLSGQAMSGLTHMWPVSLALIAACAAAFVWNNPFHRSRYQHRNWLVFAPALIPLAILVVGTVFEHHSGPRNDRPQFLIMALAILHVPALGLLLWRLPEIRWFTVAVNLLIIWCSLWAWFVSAMSVSGDWM